jgi:hypothetical protein
MGAEQEQTRVEHTLSFEQLMFHYKVAFKKQNFLFFSLNVSSIRMVSKKKGPFRAYNTPWLHFVHSFQAK